MDNLDWGQIATYVTVLILACFAGVVEFVDKLKRSREKHPMKTILFNLFAKLLMSAFAGLLTYWLLQERSENGVVILSGYSAVAISLSGYAGNQTVNILLSIWRMILEKGRTSKGTNNEND